MLLGIFALVAAPAWFSRDKFGYEQPALNASLLGVITLLIAPIQVLLVAFAMRGFNQGWNVELERREAAPGRRPVRSRRPVPGLSFPRATPAMLASAAERAAVAER